MDTEFRKKVFDEELFGFCLELLQLQESLGASGSVLWRKTLIDSFTANSSLTELREFIKTLNLMDRQGFPQNVDDFLDGALLAKKYSNELFADYRMTIRHLNELITFADWDSFFKAFHSVVAQPEIAEEYLMTVRHLVLPQFHFQNWNDFFKATIMLSGKTQMLSPFFTAARHSLNYFKKSESFKNFFHALSSNPTLSFFEAYSYGQLESKKWLVEETLKARGSNWGTVFTLAGWIGSLAQLIFDHGEIQVEKLRSFDIDSIAGKMAEKINNPQVLENWKFKSVGMDISLMNYPTTYFVKRHDGSLCELHDQPDLVINTSCEHIQDLKGWWDKIPYGTNLVLQNNNAFNIPDHINCVSSLEEFKKQLPLSKIDFAGSLELSDYTRYMLIGAK